MVSAGNYFYSYIIIAATINHNNVYTITNDYIEMINGQFVVLHTCTQTLFHARHSREMQEIFRRAHNNKRLLYLSFSDKKHALQTRAFLTTVSVRYARFITFSCRRFFDWQWQQVCDHISNLRLYYIDSGTFITTR